jgi:excisionase family DNA binding protein
MTVRQILTPREAAQMVGISYPTIKKWILKGAIKTVKTPGGHHRLTVKACRPGSMYGIKNLWLTQATAFA